MRKLILVVFINLTGLSAFTQQATLNRNLPPNAFFAKSGNNTLAWILTGGGAGLLIAGAVTQRSNQSYVPNEEIGTVLVIAGGAAVVTGIILFTSSGKNKTKGNDSGLNLKMEKISRPDKEGTIAWINNEYFPALSFRLVIK